MFNSLLKGYQEEVDKLTKRAKFGENAFLNIYQKLYEAPDPCPVLASIAVSTLIMTYSLKLLVLSMSSTRSNAFMLTINIEHTLCNETVTTWFQFVLNVSSMA